MNKLRNNIQKVWDWSSGKKSYLGGAIIFIGGGLRAINSIDNNTFKIIEAIGLSVTAVGLRHALGKVLGK